MTYCTGLSQPARQPGPPPGAGRRRGLMSRQAYRSILRSGGWRPGIPVTSPRQLPRSSRVAILEPAHYPRKGVQYGTESRPSKHPVGGHRRGMPAPGWAIQGSPVRSGRTPTAVGTEPRAGRRKGRISEHYRVGLGHADVLRSVHLHWDRSARWAPCRRRGETVTRVRRSGATLEDDRRGASQG